ncbi:hypothetical protein V8G54_023255 [Vigna mungo]|uniref:UDP-glucuronate decarboxylase n=1 Tax=Vigna mungo TaxID=3915 RepID=A0AAQ3RS16_VIGMU
MTIKLLVAWWCMKKLTLVVDEERRGYTVLKEEEGMLYSVTARLEEKQEEVYLVTPSSYPVIANEKRALMTVELQLWTKVDDAAFEGVSWKPEGGRHNEHEISLVVVDDAARTKVLVNDGGSSRWMMQRGGDEGNEMELDVHASTRGRGAAEGDADTGDEIGLLVTNTVEQMMEAMRVPLYFEKYEVHGDMRHVPEEVLDSIRKNKVCLKDGSRTPMVGFLTMATNSSNGATKQPPMPSPLRFSKFFQSNMRILVTGGAGFIGSHLVDRLMENEKNEVVVADNFFTGSKDNLKKWIGHPRFELIRHDVTEQLLIEVDQIYHLACPASPIFYKYNPVKTIKTNVIGTLNMLGLAKRVGARILLTSTSEVYGDPLVHPQPESYWGNVNPIGVRSCYDEGKRVAETLMFDYHRQHGIEIRIARIFNTYGPRMNIDDGRVVSNFIAQALRGEPLTVQVPGTQTRSFCYVSDMVDGLIRLMEGENTGPINIGNPGCITTESFDTTESSDFSAREFTMIELAENVKESGHILTARFKQQFEPRNSLIANYEYVFLINPAVEIKMVENTPDDPRQRKPDITKAKELLGWEPKVKLRDGLPLMEEDFRLRLGVPKKN